MDEALWDAGHNIVERGKPFLGAFVVSVAGHLRVVYLEEGVGVEWERPCLCSPCIVEGGESWERCVCGGEPASLLVVGDLATTKVVCYYSPTSRLLCLLTALCCGWLIIVPAWIVGGFWAPPPPGAQVI